MRRILAVLAAAAVAIVGGAIFGEQTFSGMLGALMGALLGFFVAEAALVGGGDGGPFIAVVAAVFSLGGTWMALAISTGKFHNRPAPIPGGGWAALVAAVAVALITGRRRRSTAAGSSPPP